MWQVAELDRLHVEINTYSGDQSLRYIGCVSLLSRFNKNRPLIKGA